MLVDKNNSKIRFLAEQNSSTIRTLNHIASSRLAHSLTWTMHIYIWEPISIREV
jgi:hypothetical protein